MVTKSCPTVAVTSGGRRCAVCELPMQSGSMVAQVADRVWAHPVCHPAAMGRRKPLKRPRDLTTTTWTTAGKSWRESAHGASDVRPARRNLAGPVGPGRASHARLTFLAVGRRRRKSIETRPSRPRWNSRSRMPKTCGTGAATGSTPTGWSSRRWPTNSPANASNTNAGASALRAARRPPQHSQP